jgi:hypothetical protein
MPGVNIHSHVNVLMHMIKHQADSISRMLKFAEKRNRIVTPEILTHTFYYNIFAGVTLTT